jgi:hypothetical protein
MSLATVIRMEFAYPGVGILAGDSIQYLCIATAHGVIMVFFMVMPAIFGAFGNFLLPTQLGVHDVAFPRLNSAAFWFLPGGLIMLCQLVCVDRRYQRMNCFNIRELQGILKRKFFTDLVNTSDNRLGIDSTLIGMRHRDNMSNILLYDQSLFYNFDLTNTSKFKLFSIGSPETHSYSNTKLLGTNLTDKFFLILQFLGINKPSMPINQIFKDFLFFFYSPITYSFLTFITSLSYIKFTLLTTLYIPTLSISNQNFVNKPNTNNLQDETNVYTSNYQNYNDFFSLYKSNFSDTSSSWRFNRYSYPLISYDYKTGNYLSIWDQLYPALSLSFIEVARGIRKAPWFFSDQYSDLLKTNYSMFISKFTTQLNLKLADVDN